MAVLKILQEKGATKGDGKSVFLKSVSLKKRIYASEGQKQSMCSNVSSTAERSSKIRIIIAQYILSLGVTILNV